ncbi:MAG: N-6 DNA methylase [Clostridiales bacterium]|nr:N-6 DNA methylase [Clostridiales bacterium]
MSEELLQTTPFWIGRYSYYRLGSTTLNQLKKAKIINKQSKKLSDKKPDGLITLSGGVVKAVIEYKTPDELSTKAKITKAINQELEVAKFLCKLLIVTDGTKTFWINALNGEEIKKNGKNIPFVFDAERIVSGEITVEEKIDLENLIDQAEYSLTENENNIVEPEILDPTPLAKEVWQKIWINTGKEPEKCLYNVVEIFVFKFLSDIGVLKYYNNFNSVYERKERAGAFAALTHYAADCRRTIKNDMFPKGDDGTTIFNGTIFVNEKGEANLSQAVLFADVLDCFQKYDEIHGSFKYVTKEFKTRLYETFLRQSAGVKNLGQYFTPRNVVQAMVKMSSANLLKNGARICDPFCGVGGFILETIIMNKNIFREFEPNNGIINPKIKIIGYDKGTDEKDDERTIILAKANMLIYFSDLLAKYHTKEHLHSFSNNAFNSVFHLIKSNLGTFEKIEDEKYDLILTNPPYVTNSSANIKKSASQLMTEHNKPYYSLKGRGVETLALEWIVKNLNDNGEAIIVVPDGLLTQKSIIAYLKRECQINAIISLPKNTFYATSKKTYIIAFNKKPSHILQESPVFTYIVGEIGETRDTKRFTNDINGEAIRNDLDECVKNYLLFKNGVMEFSSPRTKAYNWSDFSKFSTWLVDKNLSDEEKIKIGLLEPVNKVSENEFIKELKTIGSEIENFIKSKTEIIENINYVSLPLGKLFDFPTIKGLTEKFIRSNTGNIPVYGGRQTETPVGMIADNLPGVRYFENCLAWNREGSVGYVFLHNHKFTTNDHHRPMILKSKYIEKIDLNYIQHTLQQIILSSDAFEWSKTASKEKIKKILINIPVDANGEFDLKMQKKIYLRLKKYDTIKENLSKKIENINSMQLDF